jgi:hypothetical protein
VHYAAALVYSMAASLAERGSAPVPEPQAVVGRFAFGWMTRLPLAAVHLGMWIILARESDWGLPLPWLAQRVLCLPASEADSGCALGRMRRTPGDYAARVADGTHRRRLQMAMS